jgi:hypothetical protein
MLLMGRFREFGPFGARPEPFRRSHESPSQVRSFVTGLAECQKALGPSGYLSAFPEMFFDRVESVRSVWAPYYTIHKIMAGLIDMFESCGSGRALEAWIKPVAGNPLTFRTVKAGKPDDVTLVPFYKLFGERYAIYWQVGEPPRRAR